MHHAHSNTGVFECTCIWVCDLARVFQCAKKNIPVFESTCISVYGKQKYMCIWECVSFSVHKKIHVYLRVRVFQCSQENTCVFESTWLAVYGLVQMHHADSNALKLFRHLIKQKNKTFLAYDGVAPGDVKHSIINWQLYRSAITETLLQPKNIE